MMSQAFCSQSFEGIRWAKLANSVLVVRDGSGELERRTRGTSARECGLVPIRAPPQVPAVINLTTCVKHVIYAFFVVSPSMAIGEGIPNTKNDLTPSRFLRCFCLSAKFVNRVAWVCT